MDKAAFQRKNMFSALDLPEVSKPEPPKSKMAIRTPDAKELPKPHFSSKQPAKSAVPSTKENKSLVETLPIVEKLPEILEMVQACRKQKTPVCAVVAPTGSGKSLGIPHILAASGLRVCVSVPTITAVFSLRDRQRVLLKDAEIPVNVGYSVEGDKHYKYSDLIVYATSGHWRRKLLGMHASATVKSSNKTRSQWPSRPFCDVFILDEVHTGTIDNDLIELLFNDWRKAGYGTPLLMLASATFSPRPEIPSLTFSMKGYPVEIEYWRHDFELESGEVVQAVIDRIGMSKPDEGDILVFAAGSAEIDSWCDKIADEFPEHTVIPAYSALNGEEISKIYLPTEDGSRKIIVATNIAESSITIPQIGLILDTLTEKRAELTNAGSKALKMSWISQQSADQRKGRTGRDRSGTCVRFCTEQFFTEQLEKSRLAEIHRSPLESVLLELLGAAFKPQTLLAGLVDARRIEETMALLRRLEMIDAADYPTEKGRFVANLPISVRNGAILYDSISGKSKLPIYPTCVFLALIECANGSYLWLPRKTVTVSNSNGKERKRAQKINPEEEAEFIEKHFGRFRSDYELVSLAKIWNTMMKATGGLFSPRFKFEDYTRRNHLNTRRFLEVRALLRQLSTFFENTEGFSVESFDELDALRGRMGLFTSAYETELWMNGMSGRYRKVTNLGQGNTASLSNRQVICPTSRPNFVLALSGMTIVGNKGAFRLISLWLPCPNGPEIHNRILGSLSRPSTIDSDSD